MNASERLRELDGAATPRPWDYDWNAPQNILASDGSGKHVGRIPEPNAKVLIALRNALPLIADCIEEAEYVADEFVAKSLINALDRLQEALDERRPERKQ